MLDNQESQPISTIKKGLADMIDALLANFIRGILLLTLFHLWLKDQLLEFSDEFKAKFNADFVIFAGDADRIRFLSEHTIVKSSFLFILIIFTSGALYYILLNCSKWRGTVGKRLMKIAIVKNNGEKLSFSESLYHYLLSLFPWIFVIYIFSYYMINKGNLYNIVAHNTFNLIFGLITIAWVQIGLITGKKISAPDMICKTKLVNTN